MSRTDAYKLPEWWHAAEWDDKVPHLPYSTLVYCVERRGMWPLRTETVATGALLNFYARFAGCSTRVTGRKVEHAQARLAARRAAANGGPVP